MAWPQKIQKAEERMKKAEAALRADTESGKPYNSKRRHRLLEALKRAQSDFLTKVSRLRE